MQTVQLGSQGLVVSREGLGCMGMSAFYGPSDEQESLATLARALDLGITLFDTAEIYGPFKNEMLLAKAFKGSVWIDEALREVTDMRAVAIDDVSFGGFLAKVYKGTEAVVVRREVEPGVWMPTRLTLTGDIRALFRRATINHVIDWSEYRKMSE